MNTPKRLTARTVFIGFLLLLIMSWAGNVWYYFGVRLDKPLFLVHLGSYDINQEEIPIYYLENKTGDNRVIYIKFDELPYSSYRIEEVKEYTHHVLKVLYYKPLREENEQNEQQDLVIHEMEVVYQGIESERIPIGEIRIKTFDQSDEDSMVLTTSSGGSPDGSGLTALRMKEPAILEHVSLNQPDIEPVLQLMVNDTEYTDLQEWKLNANDPIRISYKWNLPKKGEGSMRVYNPEVQLHFKREDGSTKVETIALNESSVYFSEEQVRSYIHER